MRSAISGGAPAHVLIMRPLKGEMSGCLGLPLWYGIIPIFPRRRPFMSHPGLMAIGIPDDKTAYPARRVRGEIKSNRRTVIMFQADTTGSTAGLTTHLF
jgi:hypothetical protein